MHTQNMKNKFRFSKLVKEKGPWIFSDGDFVVLFEVYTNSFL